MKRCVTSVAIAIVMAAGYATAQTPPPENEGRAILDGLASSFAVPWRDLLKGKHNSEWRNLFDGFTGEFGIDGPLKPPDVPGRTTPLRWSDARLSASVKYTPLGYWFVNATAYHYLNEDNQRAWSPDFTYGFGYFDWHPRTFSVQYNNYAGNRYPWRRGSRAGFRDGSVSLTWSWSS